MSYYDLSQEELVELKRLVDLAIGMLIRNKPTDGERFGQGNEPVRLMRKASSIVYDMNRQNSGKSNFQKETR